ncbi:MAG: hypothetical protein GY762_19375 [Proteobacteria bacterium]|nr:hypothetical protein [Pseudomonadota bacterium]
MIPPPLFHSETLVDTLNAEIQTEAADENIQFYAAAARVLISWLDYELSQVEFIDSKDNGVDAWYVAEGSNPSESGIDLFQIKTHELDENGFLNLKTFDHRSVDDLVRAKNLLLTSNQGHKLPSTALQRLVEYWSHAIRSRQMQGVESAMPVTLNLVLLGEGLTTNAQSEFDRFQSTNQDVVFLDDDVPVQFNAVIHNIDSIINTRWREGNRDWRDISGRKQESISLSPTREGGYISDDRNAVFYCKAIDLVDAYEKLGYQLFEPNVRANIKRSRVNQAIRDSIKYARTRKEFRFLNNGVTITCKSYQAPRGGRKGFAVRFPGVVNGLQTVVALHTAYQELSDDDRSDFGRNCSVLVRILNESAVDDITKVVRATNNQNPMKPRNLVSNSPEQIWYARVFAGTLGWFYQAKEGGWDAFNKDHRRWRPPLNKTPKDFRISARKIRKVDNVDLAQCWLAFIGYSFVAWNNKKSLFDGNYEFVFKMRTMKHGYDYAYNIRKAAEEAYSNEPDPNLMLVSHLSYLFIRKIVPSPQQNRKDTLERLALDANSMSEFELQAKVLEDDTYILNQALRSMSFLFTEFVGFIFYKSLGDNIHKYGYRILNNGSFSLMKNELNIEEIRFMIDCDSYAQNDLLITLWLLFLDTAENLLASDWGQNYRQALRPARYILGNESRSRLYKEVLATNKVLKKRYIPRDWSAGFKENQSIFDFILECLQT